LDSREKALALASILMDKRALQPVLLDLRQLTLVTDYFLVASGTSAVHLQALADAVLEQMRERKLRPVGTEGRPASGWILIDFGEVVIHLFGDEQRQFYNLERLWRDAPRTDLEPQQAIASGGQS